jgi:hypothetical protein
LGREADAVKLEEWAQQLEERSGREHPIRLVDDDPWWYNIEPEL